MRDKRTFLTATTALVSCLSLAAPQMTLAQGNDEAGAGKLPVCSSVEGDVPCREPGEKGQAKGKEGGAPAEQSAEDAPASEAPDAAEAVEPDEAPEAQDAVEAPEPSDDPEQAPEAAGAEDAAPDAAPQAAEDMPAEAPKSEMADPATPAEGADDADKTRAAEEATPPADAAEEQTAEDAEDSQRPKARAESEAEAEVQAESESDVEADEQTADSLEEELREKEAAEGAEPPRTQAGADAEAEVEVEADEQTADSVDTPAGADAEAEQTTETTDTAPEATETTTTAAPAESGETPAAVRAEGEPEDVQETTVTEQNARTSDEEFRNRADADAKTEAEAGGGGGGGGLSDFEKFAIGAAGLVALDALLDNDDEVVTNSGDRVVVRRDGNLEVYRDDNELLRRPGSEVRTETYSDGSTRTVVTRDNGTQIVTVTDATGRVLRRTKIRPNGTEVVLVDDTHAVAEVDVRDLPRSNKDYVFDARGDRDALRAALRADAAGDLDRSFSLYQVRSIPQVRELMPEITVDAINFRTDSAAIQPREAEELRALGEAMNEFLDENPDELFLIEGHTDAVGNEAYNLALSDRRAESVALALTEYFDVPPENMVIQGYGESQLRVETEESSRQNRRAVVRRITPLLETASR